MSATTMDLGRVGIWTGAMDAMTSREAGGVAVETGIGLGIELNDTTRCIDATGDAVSRPIRNCDERDIEVLLNSGGDRVDVNTAEFNSIDIATRLSIGVAID